MAFKSLNPQLLSYSQAINEKKELVFQLIFWKKAKTTKTFSFHFLKLHWRRALLPQMIRFPEK